MRFINWILLLPFVVIAISFAVTNREDVALALWPLPFEIQVPLALFSFIILLIGFLFGGLATWFGNHKNRRNAREDRLRVQELERDLRVTKAERDSLKKETEPTPANDQAALPIVATK